MAGLGVVVLAVAAGAAVAAGRGGDDVPEHLAGTAADTATGGTGIPAADSADAGFARDMAVHHQQAVEMSLLVRDRTADDEVRLLAYDIAQTQANQRGMMLGWLDLWGLPKTAPGGAGPMAWMGDDAAGDGDGDGDGSEGGHAGGGGHEGHGGQDGAGTPGGPMPGMATDAELRRLGEAEGRAAEVLFLRLMTDHHEGGVIMAAACAERCAVPAERRLARGMVAAQRSELKLMADMLVERGARPRT
ncbi:DUF305 domain-containing protein [uncultured Streptomyces sp.]|uniref:DUF305 domain-containing protein n=1 Tax=uncultured Streptomyces sp. TaxID=174707 RepID=UPI00260E3D0D|nr:DUF305 domain-containing protein [uncultured Streptomyces sp.]